MLRIGIVAFLSVQFGCSPATNSQPSNSHPPQKTTAEEFGPDMAYRAIAKAGESGDFGTVWDSIDKRSQGKAETIFQLGTSMAPTPEYREKVKTLRGRELFVYVMKAEKKQDKFKVEKVELTSQDGDTATLSVKKSGGKTESVKMIREDGLWKWSFTG